MASLISQASGGTAHLGKNWVRKFIKRNPVLQTKKGIAIASQRVHDLYLSAFKSWFSILQSLFICKGVRDCNIYNMDETGNAMGPCANQTILGSIDSKQSYRSTVEDCEWVSVIECICADGTALQPVVIFKGESVQMQWFIPDRTPDWIYTARESAYTSNDVGLRWLKEIFIPQTTSKVQRNEYRLLLLDGHRSHCTLEFMWTCFEHHIIPYYLVAHASHILQPLDLTVFSSLKTKYRAAVNLDRYMHDIPPVKKQRFLDYYQIARKESFNRQNISSGFASAGIVPWCPRKVLNSPFIITDSKNFVPSTVLVQQASQTSLDVPKTPSNRRELYQRRIQLTATIKLDRSTSQLLQSTERAFDRLHTENAALKRRSDIAESINKDHAAKRKKQEPVDLNKKFISIEDIKAREGGVSRQSTPTPTARRVPARSQTPVRPLNELQQASLAIIRRLGHL